MKDIYSELFNALLGFQIKRLDAEILYGKDAPDFCGTPHSERELANNVAMCRLAQSLDEPSGLLTAEEIAMVFSVPLPMLGVNYKEAIA